MHLKNIINKMKLNLKKKLECTAMGFPMECT